MNGNLCQPQPMKSAWEDSPGWPGSQLQRADIESRISAYNDYYKGTERQVTTQGTDRLVIEGSLRIFWEVRSTISFQKLDDTVVPKEANGTRDWRRSYCDSQGLDEKLLRSIEPGYPLKRSEEVEDIKMASLNLDEENDNKESSTNSPNCSSTIESVRFSTLGGISVVQRRKKARKCRRRLSMINGHLYDLDTSNFTPNLGSVTSVHVTSRDNTHAVAKLLLHKFKVQNNPDEFCLCSVKKNGETRILQDTDYPLLHRVLLGPLEEEAHICLRDKHTVKDISFQVAEFMNLPESMLNSFLQKLDDDERSERHTIVAKYQKIRNFIEDRLTDLETPNWGID